MVVPDDKLFWEEVRRSVEQVEAVRDRLIQLQVGRRKAVIKSSPDPGGDAIVILLTDADPLAPEALIVP